MKNFFILQALVLLALNGTTLGMQQRIAITKLLLRKNQQRAYFMRSDIPNEELKKIKSDLPKIVTNEDKENNQKLYIVTITPVDRKKGAFIEFCKIYSAIKDPRTKIYLMKRNKE